SLLTPAWYRQRRDGPVRNAVKNASQTGAHLPVEWRPEGEIGTPGTSGRFEGHAEAGQAGGVWRGPGRVARRLERPELYRAELTPHACTITELRDPRPSRTAETFPRKRPGGWRRRDPRGDAPCGGRRAARHGAADAGDPAGAAAGAP